ncbi:hypothetical protein EDB19DRAFT_1909327 [Suillus lakei]|nr:hypothetical protein EDB19DRAFT_1909327 [Suillus lakei]
MTPELLSTLNPKPHHLPLHLLDTRTNRTPAPLTNRPGNPRHKYSVYASASTGGAILGLPPPKFTSRLSPQAARTNPHTRIEHSNPISAARKYGLSVHLSEQPSLLTRQQESSTSSHSFHASLPMAGSMDVPGGVAYRLPTAPAVAA